MFCQCARKGIHRKAPVWQPLRDAQRGDATGVDRVRAQEYEQNFRENIRNPVEKRVGLLGMWCHPAAGGLLPYSDF